MPRDLGILWQWQYDERFVNLLDQVCSSQGKTSYLVSSHNREESLRMIKAGELRFRMVLDRATDCDPAFIPVVQLLQEAGSRILNQPERAAYAENKKTMHYELIKAGLNVPYTVMLSPSERLPTEALDTLGEPFVIKPAEGGGGEGVLLGATNAHDVTRMREDYPGVPILIQEKIIPRELHGRRYWFRVFYVCGQVVPCFWDHRTHVYERLSHFEELDFAELEKIAGKIGEITGLDFFSTEVAQIEDGRFVVVDYVNDQCDMRFQSDTPDGVPDAVIEEIARALVRTL